MIHAIFVVMLTPSRLGFLGALVAIGLVGSSTSIVAAPSVERIAELFLPPEFGTPEISPGGEYAGFIIRHGNDFGLGTYTFATRKMESIGMKDIVPLDVWWKTPRQLLIRTTSVERDSYGYTLIDVDGTKSEDASRLAEAGSQIVDPLPDEPRNVLMFRGGVLGRANIDSGNFDSGIFSEFSGSRGWAWHCFFDDQKRFRAIFARDDQGNSKFEWRGLNSSDWHKQEFQPGEKEYWPIGFDDDPRYLWLIDLTQETEAVVARFDTTNAQRMTVVRRPGLDPTYVSASGNIKRPVAVGYGQGARVELVALSEPQRAGIEKLQQKFADLFPEIIEASRDPHRWVVRLHNSRVPGVYVLFDSTTGEAVPIMHSHGGELSERRLAPSEYFAFARRNGAKMTARLWRPAEIARPPLVVLTPDFMPGPPVADTYDAHTQALVELGFAVIRVNVRGTWGFGTAMRATPDGDVAQTLTEDLEDAVKALADKSIVDGKRVAIMGAGMSGMLALLVAKHSHSFAAVVGLNVPARVTRNDLMQFSDSGGVNTLSTRLGGWSRSAEVAKQMSPVVVAPQIQIPAFYLFNEEAMKGRMVENGRDIQSAVKSARAPAQFALAFSYSERPAPGYPEKPKLPLVRARESAVIVMKMAEFLTKTMPAAKTP